MLEKPLTAKQEAFAQAVAGGSKQSDAYRSAYNASQMSDKQVWEEASKLVAHPKVSQRVEELRAKLAAVTEKKELWNKEMSVKVLAQVALRSVKDGDRVRAIAEINKMHGWHAPTQHEVTGSIETVPAYDYSKLTDDVLKAILDAKTGPDTNS